jgi:hypothetical protein
MLTVFPNPSLAISRYLAVGKKEPPFLAGKKKALFSLHFFSRFMSSMMAARWSAIRRLLSNIFSRNRA